jgi:hypothetical protein
MPSLKEQYEQLVRVYEPIDFRMPDGGWMAVSPAIITLAIGVAWFLSSLPGV